MAKYKNKTKLPSGVEFERIETLSPEIPNADAIKTHIIEWSDTSKRKIELVTIKQYDVDWQNEITTNVLDFTHNEISSNSDAILQTEPENIGVVIYYKPFKPGEEYAVWFIVSIQLEGTVDAFDVAFYSYIKGGNPTNGQGDVNKPAGGGG